MPRPRQRVCGLRRSAKMIRSIAFLALGLATYGSILFYRGQDEVRFTFMGTEGSAYPRVEIYIGFLAFTILWAGGNILLLKAYGGSWLRTIRIMGTRYRVTETNKQTVMSGIWVTGVGLLACVAVSLIPAGDFRLERIELIGALSLGLLSSFGSAFWASRKIQAEQGGASDRDNAPV